ncbi:MAG: LPXTG cell wall anchor domain-containing protein [Ilumatobacteraceae bacterium]
MAAASAPLPATGNDSNQTLLIAGSTLLAGLGLAGVGLRRRQHSAAS